MGAVSVSRIRNATIAAVLKRNISPAAHSIPEINRDIEVARIGLVQDVGEGNVSERHTRSNFERLETLGHVAVRCAL